jgi:hypothetical protein
MGRALRELTVSLRSMIFMRKLKGVSVFNPIEALGIIPGSDQDEEKICKLTDN